MIQSHVHDWVGTGLDPASPYSATAPQGRDETLHDYLMRQTQAMAAHIARLHARDHRRAQWRYATYAAQTGLALGPLACLLAPFPWPFSWFATSLLVATGLFPIWGGILSIRLMRWWQGGYDHGPESLGQ